MLIALHGKLQSGKDTTFERIQKFVPNAVRISFADPLKDSVAALLGITREEIELMKLSDEPSVKVRIPSERFPNTHIIHDISMRQFLQRYGTESHRDIFGDDFWVKQALKKAVDKNKLYVITDCRFLNEAQAVRGLGWEGLVIRVLGPNDEPTDGHSSEQLLPEHMIDYVVDNSLRDDNFSNLDEQVARLLVSVGYGPQWEASANEFMRYLK